MIMTNNSHPYQRAQVQSIFVLDVFVFESSFARVNCFVSHYPFRSLQFLELICYHWLIKILFCERSPLSSSILSPSISLVSLVFETPVSFLSETSLVLGTFEPVEDSTLDVPFDDDAEDDGWTDDMTFADEDCDASSSLNWEQIKKCLD